MQPRTYYRTAPIACTDCQQHKVEVCDLSLQEKNCGSTDTLKCVLPENAQSGTDPCERCARDRHLKCSLIYEPIDTTTAPTTRHEVLASFFQSILSNTPKTPSMSVTSSSDTTGTGTQNERNPFKEMNVQTETFSETSVQESETGAIQSSGMNSKNTSSGSPPEPPEATVISLHPSPQFPAYLESEGPAFTQDAMWDNASLQAAWVGFRGRVGASVNECVYSSSEMTETCPFHHALANFDRVDRDERGERSSS